jgi:hypothetical protein
MNQLQTQSKPTLWQRLFQRIGLAARAFMAPLDSPRIQLKNGTILDLSTNTVIVNGAFTLHSTGELCLSTDEHLILLSGRTPEERPGYQHSIWLNPDFDDKGRPVQDDFDLIEVSEECHEDHGSQTQCSESRSS